MPYPEPNNYPLLLGGDRDVNETRFLEDIDLTGDIDFAKVQTRKGVYANYPAMTPKYVNNNTDASLETMARLMIPLSSERLRAKFLATFRGETRKLAEALATLGETERGTERSYGLGYIDFLLTMAQESFDEKVQINDVLSDNYVSFFFGKRPPVFQYTGVLFNTRQDDWRSAFTIIYNDIIRGTELARRKAVVTLSYDNMAVTGALVRMNQVLRAEQQMASQFDFSILVKRIDIERTIGHPPTQVATFPSFIKPATFAPVQFGVPPKTIRVTGVPQSVTVERKKPEDERPAFVGGDVTITEYSKMSQDVYGGLTPEGATVDTILLTGQGVHGP